MGVQVRPAEPLQLRKMRISRLTIKTKAVGSAKELPFISGMDSYRF